MFHARSRADPQRRCVESEDDDAYPPSKASSKKTPGNKKTAKASGSKAAATKNNAKPAAASTDRQTRATSRTPSFSQLPPASYPLPPVTQNPAKTRPDRGRKPAKVQEEDELEED
jgi:hypothetical protein